LPTNLDPAETRAAAVAGLTPRDVQLALALRLADESGDDLRILYALNDLCAHLDLDPNETEQGLSENAAEQIDTYVSLVLIAAGTALSAEVENDLEDRGLVRQTDQPYAEITEAGLAILRREKS
jgi:hypothetical protein